MSGERPPPTPEPHTTPQSPQLATASGTVDVGDRSFRWAEGQHGRGPMRKFSIREVGAGVHDSEQVVYKPDPSPVTVDNNWYHNNAARWYNLAATLVANVYVGHNNKWQTLVRGEIHGHEYEMHLQ